MSMTLNSAGNVVALSMQPNAGDGLSLQADPEFYL
jgi:hypothetical protein